MNPEQRKGLLDSVFIQLCILISTEMKRWPNKMARCYGTQDREVVHTTGEWTNHSVIFSLSHRVVRRWCAATSSLTSCLNMSGITMLTIIHTSWRGRSAAYLVSNQPGLRSNTTVKVPSLNAFNLRNASVHLQHHARLSTWCNFLTDSTTNTHLGAK